MRQVSICFFALIVIKEDKARKWKLEYMNVFITKGNKCLAGTGVRAA